MLMSAYVNRTWPRVPTELIVPMSAKSTPRARGGLCLAAGICPGWVEGMVAVGRGTNGRAASLDFGRGESENLTNPYNEP